MRVFDESNTILTVVAVGLGVLEKLQSGLSAGSKLLRSESKKVTCGEGQLRHPVPHQQTSHSAFTIETALRNCAYGTNIVKLNKVTKTGDPQRFLQVLTCASITMAALFTTERHVKYYLRCLKTFLPSAYTSNDSNRMLLAYFSLSGLDVLGVLQAKTTPEERQSYINWLYHCQVSSGGFRGFPGTDFGEERRTVDNAVWDPANVPATFFALVNLLILGDDLSRVKRRKCLEWLPRLQRTDGSFGEVLGPDARIEGDRDLRYCMCAAGIRYILRGSTSKGVEDVDDIDVPGFMSFIQACQVISVHEVYILTSLFSSWFTNSRFPN